MRLSNQTYDTLKWFVLVVMPSVSVLFQGLGELYSYESTFLVVSTLNLFTAFLGTILQISSNNYHGGGSNGNSSNAY
ncbi:holin [Aerococcaceae bacterium DSM 111176]|nr:holin [Aerococcaceae bacterium DSM 111176]